MNDTISKPVSLVQRGLVKPDGQTYFMLAYVMFLKNKTKGICVFHKKRPYFKLISDITCNMMQCIFDTVKRILIFWLKFKNTTLASVRDHN